MNLGDYGWHQVRVTAAVLCATAAVLTVCGLFPALYSIEVGSGERTFSATVNAWRMDVDGLGAESGGNAAPKVGYPLVFAAVALVCAAVGNGFAAPRRTTAGGRMSGLITAIAGAFLAGTVWTMVLQATSWVDNVADFGGSVSVDVDAGYGPGFWLLLVATLAAVLAAVLALVPVRRRYPIPMPLDPAIANLPTPPYGIAIPVLAQEQAPPPPVLAQAPPPPVVAVLPTPVPFQPPGATTPAPAAPPAPMPSPVPPAPAELVLPDLPPAEPAIAHAPAVPAVEDPLAPPPLGSITDGQHRP